MMIYKQTLKNKIHFQFKYISLILILSNALILESCIDIDNKKGNTAILALNQTYQINKDSIATDYMTWYKYTNNNIRLSSNFIGLDIDSSLINKESFLIKLKTENVIAFKIKLIKGQSVYKLYKSKSSDSSIKIVNKQLANAQYNNFKMEGTQFPLFAFKDINNKSYSSLTTKGKIVVLKCWFIHCTTCIEEFPQLNKLIENYKNRNDIIFISLAIDNKSNLLKFLENHEFKYATIPDMKSFMIDKLNIQTFPTHILIDKSGKIKKVVNKINELIPFLENEED